LSTRAHTLGRRSRNFMAPPRGCACGRAGLLSPCI
jgi:hypothetical protein